MKEILIVVPSRSSNGKRIKNIEELRQTWLDTTSGLSDLCVAIDSDDENYYPRLENIIYEVNERKRMVGTLNLIANKFCEKYKYIMFLGDDHRFRTNMWEEKFLQHGRKTKNAIAYGNDLLQGQNLPTAVFMDSEIIKKLGFMVPDCLVHMYADNFWLETGRALGSIAYFHDVIIEHMHPAAQKVSTDEQYAEVDTFANPDRIAFSNYMMSQFNSDIKKLL